VGEPSEVRELRVVSSSTCEDFNCDVKTLCVLSCRGTESV
jgi:hypothetical protein